MASFTIPVWLDCDPGHDDVFAILLAAHHPSLNLLGISTVHGNASLENTTANATRVLEAIGRSDIAVYPGSRKPFCRAVVHAPDIHGRSGLDGTELLPVASRAPVLDINAIVAMRDALLSQPAGTAWLVTTGTLTNIALLFATFPEVADHIKGLSIMGGAIGDGFTDVPISRLPGDESLVGNTTPWAEFNIYCDPEASHSVLSHPVLSAKTTLIALDLTHQVLADVSVQERILNTSISQASTAGELRRMLYELLVFFANTYHSTFGMPDPPLHDPLAMAVLLSNLNPSYAAINEAPVLKFSDKNGERFAVQVVTDGQHGSDPATTGQLGRTIAKPVEGSGMIIPRAVDNEAFWNLILLCLERAELCSPLKK